MSGGVRNEGRWHVQDTYHKGVSGMEGGGMLGIHTAGGTGTPWLMEIPGMIPACWEVRKCSLYSLYKPPVSPVVRKDKQATIQTIYQSFLLSYTLTLLFTFPTQLVPHNNNSDLLVQEQVSLDYLVIISEVRSCG